MILYGDIKQWLKTWRWCGRVAGSNPHLVVREGLILFSSQRAGNCRACASWLVVEHYRTHCEFLTFDTCSCRTLSRFYKGLLSDLMTAQCLLTACYRDNSSLNVMLACWDLQLASCPLSLRNVVTRCTYSRPSDTLFLLVFSSYTSCVMYFFFKHQSSPMEPISDPLNPRVLNYGGDLKSHNDPAIKSSRVRRMTMREVTFKRNRDKWKSIWKRLYLLPLLAAQFIKWQHQMKNPSGPEAVAEHRSYLEQNSVRWVYIFCAVVLFLYRGLVEMLPFNTAAFYQNSVMRITI